MDLLKQGMGTAFNPAAGIFSGITGNEGDFRQADPIMGGLLGFKSNEEQAVEEAFKKMQAEIQKYRPMAAGARMQGLSNQLGMFGPVNGILEKMYGPGATFDTSTLLQNPMGKMFASPLPAQAGNMAEPARNVLSGMGGAPPPLSQQLGPRSWQQPSRPVPTGRGGGFIGR